MDCRFANWFSALSSDAVLLLTVGSEFASMFSEYTFFTLIEGLLYSFFITSKIYKLDIGMAKAAITQPLLMPLVTYESPFCRLQ
jgi:hypothetical protein